MALTKVQIETRLGSNQRAMRKNIRSYFNQATAEQIEQGRAWYGNALDVAITVSELADVSIEHGAAIVSAYSPQCSWKANKEAALEFAEHGTKRTGILGESHERAKRVLRADNPIAELNAKTGKAHKIVSFARNILGETDTVTIDVWAVRAALGPNYVGNPEHALRRTGAYAMVSEAYLAVAKELGLSGPVVQAICWCVIRGKAD